MIRTIIMLTLWALMGPFAALIGFVAAFLMGDIRVLYFLFTRGAWVGVRMAGVRFETIGLDRFDHSRSYIYMTNHTSNLDPPIQVGLIPRSTSVMVKKELFKVPILGRAMRMGSLVPVDRGNRDAGIDAVREARAVIEKGMNMLIYVEGKRSFDGKLLPFKKGPFYMAVECGVPVVPITIVGTHYAMPKGRFAIKPGRVQVIFHPPIEPKDFENREALMEKVRTVIESGLPEEYKQPKPFTTGVTESHKEQSA
ncbi:MAG TPA: lysophospholipid acyltransferase family protein [Candidatus Sulfotelmatobacter sp.]|nr:lysophospholipid acyltransferase family protein [Candidatus Sulfotelmatobacter sp.]